MIGRNVRLYQAVTLGAKRFETDDGRRRCVKGYPRHPIVEDDVVIYAGATILGRITIGGLVDRRQRLAHPQRAARQPITQAKAATNSSLAGTEFKSAVRRNPLSASRLRHTDQRLNRKRGKMYGRRA